MPRDSYGSQRTSQWSQSFLPFSSSGCQSRRKALLPIELSFQSLRPCVFFLHEKEKLPASSLFIELAESVEHMSQQSNLDSRYLSILGVFHPFMGQSTLTDTTYDNWSPNFSSSSCFLLCHLLLLLNEMLPCRQTVVKSYKIRNNFGSQIIFLIFLLHLVLFLCVWI